MTKIVAIDTETTSLRPDRRVWEVALIVREPGRADYEWTTFVDIRDLDLGNADPFALKVGRFDERHPQRRDPGQLGVMVHLDRLPDELHLSERYVMRAVEHWTRGAHLIGAVPNFDADVLDRRMRANGVLPSWHYHLIDVEALAVGWLNGVARRAIDESGMRGEAAPSVDWSRTAPPWKSDELSRACGVEPPTEADRHTALGDARWALRLYDAITGHGGRA